MMVSTTTQPRIVFVVGLFIAFFAISLQVVQSDEQSDSVISEVQCRPYIEKALKGREAGFVDEGNVDEKNYVESPHSEEKKEDEAENEDEKASLEAGHDVKDSGEDSKESGDTEDLNKSNESNEEVKVENEDEESKEKNYQSVESAEQNQSNEDSVEANQQHENVDNEQDSKESSVESDENKSSDNGQDSKESTVESNENKSSEDAVKDDGDKTEEEKDDSKSLEAEEEKKDSADVSDEIFKTSEEIKDTKSEETIKEISVSLENKTEDSSESDEVKSSTENDSKENENVTVESEEKKDESSEENTQIVDDASEEKDQRSERQKREPVDDNKSAEKSEEKLDDKSAEQSAEKSEEKPDDKSAEQSEEKPDDKSEGKPDDKSGEKSEEKSGEIVDDKSEENDGTESKENDKSEENEPTPEEDLIQEIEIPKNLRPREHINQILKLDQDNEEKEAAIQKASDVVLKELKRLYDTAIKPLETLYKYRDLSNRHFGDPEIFSKPLVLLMGPWSGGKSSIINYLLDNEYQPTALRTGGVQECIGENCKPPNGTDPGAEPSPAYFNILMHGEEQEVLDGTQLAADWTFSGLQKFGQGMLDRLRGLKLNNKLLEKVNIVEIPGILEIRKQVQRLFPFNDACQWFIDRADIIFLVYDPSKLDVGPETEAILDQLKGREYQTRIILNKADQVKPEELMRVQGALIWNISPLMSSAEPPVMYSTSLWSLPYEAGAPTRLLYAQERAFLRDLRSAIDKRVEHKIASARRFAVRVRNHAKMVDCYLTTYFNHKTFFGNKKDTSDKIIESPQDYHIYEGLSTLTNISRYDLPDPDVYRDFFRLNALHEFQPLSSTCTYFRGCPINRLDVAIAYDLPELVGKYRKLVESTLNENNNNNNNNSQQSTS